jgi:threonine/homoserine/homoserine lactone efflux protein
MIWNYIDVSVLPVFLVAVVLICVAPGPDMVYIVATGVAGGRAAAIRASLGITLGVLIYVIAVAAGLGVVVSDYPAVLVAVQIFGCLYLAWMAFTTVRDARATQSQKATLRSDWFRRGLVVNLTNPKVILFIVAFLPQFLGNATNPILQLLMLGLLFQLVGLIIDIAIGWSAGSIRDKVLARPGTRRTMAYASAAAFAALAIVVGIDAVIAITQLGSMFH